MTLMSRKRIQKLHLVGIGGSGMSGIAEVLHENGFVVTGSDTGSGEPIEYLKKIGISIKKDHAAKNVEGVDLVVYSSAIGKDNIELIEAKMRHIPIIRRAEMLGELMRLKYTLAIAGTHGKTTTTSIVGAIWEAAGLDPTVILGGVVKGKGSGAQVGRGSYLIAESDEFDRSFLSMMPSSAVITNIDEDHLDTYKNIEEIKAAFIEFANKVPFYGQVILCLDDLNIQSILSKLLKPVVTYGFSSQAIYRIKNLETKSEVSHFDIYKNNEYLESFEFKKPGKHNVLNATAAIALAVEEKIPLSVIKNAVSDFKGVRRRFELMGEAKNISVYNDYAHHPTEVEATLQGFRDAYPNKRLVVVFQPHLYSRTRDLHEAFGTAFGNCDVFYCTDIYPAREAPIEGVTGDLVVRSAQNRGHRDAHYILKDDELVVKLKKELKENDIVIFMGAGNIWLEGNKLLEVLNA
ncbi:MAG: UDP-N-acetylmuramate--L-alanine ligase [Fibrobacter sp.]|jgi:UDP-N-acetylmuramate--alanine ligase|nr:UDP-N-acetylmuramate--L-alanine ligase [Fibrobacter sp.]